MTAEIIEWEVAPGKIVAGWAYNGQIPGPMIRAELGDETEVVVNNELPLGTDVHSQMKIPDACGARSSSVTSTCPSPARPSVVARCPTT